MKLVKNFDTVKKAFLENQAEALREVGIVITAESQARTPVDTGRLRREQSFEVSGNQVDIGTNVEYAIYVEFGTSRQREQSFLRSALSENTDKIESIIKKHFKNGYGFDINTTDVSKL